MIGGIVSLGIVFGISSGDAIAHQSHPDSSHPESAGEFQRIDQPLWAKGVVTAGGLGLIGLETWWFLWGKPKSRQTASSEESRQP